MDDKEKRQPQSEPAPQPETAAAADTSAKKPYKSPTIKRHGNLRLMTQLE